MGKGSISSATDSITNGWGVEFEGTKAVQKRLDIIERKAPGHFAAALHARASEIGNTIQEWTPVRSGTLQRSLKISKPAINKWTGDVEVTMTQDTKYAARVHQLDSLISPRNENATPHWWFKAMEKHAPAFKSNLLSSAMEALEEDIQMGFMTE